MALFGVLSNYVVIKYVYWVGGGGPLLLWLRALQDWILLPGGPGRPFSPAMPTPMSPLSPLVPGNPETKEIKLSPVSKQKNDSHVDC